MSDHSSLTQKFAKMKSRIRYSRYATLLTIIILGVLFICCIVSIHEKPVFFTLLPIYIVLIISAFFYAPAYIETTPDYVIMGSILKSKRIHMSDIESVELFQPTMGAIRIFASGGFMGYWGMFRERDIGRYYAFYGKASDCFLIRMKNGDKYVLGCDDPSKMVACIRSHI